MHSIIWTIKVLVCTLSMDECILLAPSQTVTIFEVARWLRVQTSQPVPWLLDFLLGIAEEDGDCTCFVYLFMLFCKRTQKCYSSRCMQAWLMLQNTDKKNLRVCDQNGVSLLYIIVDIHHPSRKPSKWYMTRCVHSVFCTMIRFHDKKNHP